MAEKSIDLLDVCRRANAAWQYIDCKLTTEKLTKIEKCPYPDVKSFSGIFGSMRVSESFQKHATCTKFTMQMQLSFNDSDRTSKKNVSTVKNLFAINDAIKLSFKEKQSIYWILRLRYACGIVPISVLKMIPNLRKLGYRSWRLPNGEVVSFENTWLGDIYVSPKKFHVIETIIPMMDVITEPVEGFSGFMDDGSPYLQHAVILAKTKAAGENPYVIDPTALQFNLPGPNGTLIMHGDWVEYVNAFPGEIKIQSIKDGEDARIRLDRSWDIGNATFNHCERLIKSVIENIKKPSCNHCGEIQNVPDGNIRLLDCGRCKSVKYCDKLCQKAGWKSHSSVCKAE